MSRVDEELSKALEESERLAQAEPVHVVSAQVAPEAAKPKRNLGLLLALLVMGGGILALVFTSFENAVVYTRHADEVVRDRVKLEGRALRVEGILVKGTLKRRDQPCEYRFSIERGGATLPVRYPQCVVPDTFRDMPGTDVKVTVEGQLAEAGHLEATTIFAQCPSKYEMQDRAINGEKIPHQTGPAAVL
jgi:cytochrome c-type biogenesis protein CcmE